MHVLFKSFVGCLWVLLFIVPAWGQEPTDPIESFGKAKALARDEVYKNHPITFYCRCTYAPKGRSGGIIDASDCGFQPRKNMKRGKRVEWEHIVLASRLAGGRQCWTVGHTDCAKKGRACCEKKGIDAEARHMINDLHNLVPSVGELNADRSNLPYGIIVGEPRQYGACDFEVGGQPKVTEPAEALRGNTARIWLYMDQTYGLNLSAEERTQLLAWSAADPVGEWERERDRRILKIQGNSNPFVAGPDEENEEEE